MSFLIKSSALFILLTTTLTTFSQKRLTNDLIWGSESPFGINKVDQVRSMNDGEYFTALNYNNGKWTIDKFSFASYDSIGTILSSDDIKAYKTLMVQSYEFNKDEKKMLLATQITPIYRRSFEAVYYIHDLVSGRTKKLSNDAVMHAEFSPNGKKVAYIKNNNLHVYDIDSDSHFNITSDGEFNAIINGATDWVYEEEFAIAKAYQWSPDSRSIAYMKFIEAEVKEFQMTIYGSLYPYQYDFKYPKAGEDNSKVNVFVYDVEKRREYDLNITQGKALYIPRINWTNEGNKLLVQTLNRHQNNLKYLLFTIDFQGSSQKENISQKVVYSETSDTYIEIDDNLIFTKDKKGFYRTSEKDGYNHIYRIDFNGDSQQVTRGEWDVIEFKGLSENGKTIYYLSAEDGAMYQNLYAIGRDGKKKLKLSSKQGHNDAYFSTGMKYYINFYSSANSPDYITLHKSDGSLIKALETNKELRAELESYDLPKKEFITVPGAEGDLNGWIMKPKDFDPAKKYPVYLFVYGGPGSNTVIDTYSGRTFLWHSMLTQMGYIVLSVDPRGTMYRGAQFKKSTYMQLGKLETEDMIATAKWLHEQEWVDTGRIGIQGWSYGGYMASLCMTKGAEYFKAGIAVAPVTNWRFYDTIYTERFMRTPQENPEGYDDNSPINHVEKLEGPYLLIHGAADDNVHLQNTMEMVTALIKANKQFDLFVYPNKNHGIYGGNTRLHLFNMITDFVKENL